MRSVAIYRHQLFKRSEPFVEKQAAHLQGVRAMLVGRERLGEGRGVVASMAMADFPRHRGLVARAHHAITLDPRPVSRLLRDCGIELMHAHFGIDGVYAQRVAGVLGVPLITTFHGFDATATRAAHVRSGSPARINYVLHRKRLARSGDLFLCASEFIRQRVIRLGFPEERTRVHYIGVDVSATLEQANRSSRPSILHVGRLVEVKGTQTLLEAFASVARAFPDLELLIVGDGPLRGALEAKAQQLGVAQQVRFLGERSHPEVLDLMRRASLLCLPSTTTATGETEGLGIVLLEAAAAGMPVVATRNGGIPEAVVDGVTGLLCKERDAGALAENLCMLIGSASLREAMGEAARAHVEEHFNIAKQSASLSDIYRSLM